MGDFLDMSDIYYVPKRPDNYAVDDWAYKYAYTPEYYNWLGWDTYDWDWHSDVRAKGVNSFESYFDKDNNIEMIEINPAVIYPTSNGTRVSAAYTRGVPESGMSDNDIIKTYPMSYYRTIYKQPERADTVYSGAVANPATYSINGDMHNYTDISRDLAKKIFYKLINDKSVVAFDAKSKKRLKELRAEEKAKMEEEARQRYLLEQATKWKYRTWLDVNRELDSPYPILETDEERAARLAPETPEQYKARVAAELGLYHKGGRLIPKRFKLK